VLLQVGAIARHDLRQSAHLVKRSAIDRDSAERGSERLVARDGKAAHRHAMHRSEHHHTPHDAARRGELFISMGRDTTGVDIAGVRHDQRLRKAQARLGLLHAAEKLV
jgi:hypothetical protein